MQSSCLDAIVAYSSEPWWGRYSQLPCNLKLPLNFQFILNFEVDFLIGGTSQGLSTLKRLSKEATGYNQKDPFNQKEKEGNPKSQAYEERTADQDECYL